MKDLLINTNYEQIRLPAMSQVVLVVINNTITTTILNSLFCTYFLEPVLPELCYCWQYRTSYPCSWGALVYPPVCKIYKRTTYLKSKSTSCTWTHCFPFIYSTLTTKAVYSLSKNWQWSSAGCLRVVQIQITSVLFKWCWLWNHLHVWHLTCKKWKWKI